MADKKCSENDAHRPHKWIDPKTGIRYDCPGKK